MFTPLVDEYRIGMAITLPERREELLTQLERCKQIIITFAISQLRNNTSLTTIMYDPQAANTSNWCKRLFKEWVSHEHEIHSQGKCFKDRCAPDCFNQKVADLVLTALRDHYFSFETTLIRGCTHVTWCPYSDGNALSGGRFQAIRRLFIPAATIANRLAHSMLIEWFTGAFEGRQVNPSLWNRINPNGYFSVVERVGKEFCSIYANVFIDNIVNRPNWDENDITRLRKNCSYKMVLTVKHTSFKYYLEDIFLKAMRQYKDDPTILEVLFSKLSRFQAWSYFPYLTNPRFREGYNIMSAMEEKLKKVE